MYDPVTARFMQEDTYRGDKNEPLSLNLYTYCHNEPLMYVDPDGHEQIVISGGDYSDESIKKGFSYNFIESSLRKIIDLRAANRNENISWIIADAGWNKNDWDNFGKAVKGLNVNIIKIKNKNNLISYLNNKNGGNSRENDKITKVAVFAHGTKGKIMLGYNYNSSYNTDLDISVKDIGSINGNAFNNPNSWFGSCNTGTGGKNSFAQACVNKVGGKTWAFEGKTTYQYIMYPKDYFTAFNKVTRKLKISPWKSYENTVAGLRKGFGFSSIGSTYYPEADSGAREVIFTI